MIYIFHHNDADGFCSALAAYLKFGNKAKFYYLNYDSKFPFDFNEFSITDEVYILGFSFNREITEEIKKRVKKIVLLDHHETTFFEFQNDDFLIYDKEKSACVISFEYFFPNVEIPKLFLLVQDRDLWKFEYKETEDFISGLSANKNFKDLNFWKKLYKDKFLLEEIIEEGKIFNKCKNHFTEDFVNKKKYQVIRWRDFNVAFYNTNNYISDIASNILKNNKDVDITISFFFTNENKFIFNLRTREESSIHVGNICKEFNGGEHKNAAGFVLNFSDGSKFISELIGEKF